MLGLGGLGYWVDNSAEGEQVRRALGRLLLLPPPFCRGCPQAPRIAAYRRLAHVYRSQGDFTRAADCLRQAREDRNANCRLTMPARMSV